MSRREKRTLQHRAGVPVLIALALLAAALATGSPLFLSAALLGWTLILFSLISVLWAGRTLTVESMLSHGAVARGEDVQLQIEVRYRGLIPVAPLSVQITAGPDRPEQTVQVSGMPGAAKKLNLSFHASHVGVTSPGVKLIEVHDLLGLFSMSIIPQVKGGELTVLPLPFDVGELIYAAGDSGTESMARAAEDVTSPADVRTYQPGDAMKKIHWKLSARKQELLVRRYEAPVMPDALVLLDCSEPPVQASEEAQADLCDALLETAASVMQENIRSDHPARLPIHGAHPIELDRNMGMPMILDSLARVDFTAPDRFERMLHLEMRRMRKVGCTIIVTARLNSRMVDVISSMRRLGPYVRLYLISFEPDTPQVLPMVSRLQNAGVEVCYVTPVAL